jgi:hypothetical protein
MGSTNGISTYSKWSFLDGTRCYTSKQGMYKNNGYAMASGLIYSNSSWVNYEVDFGNDT